MKGSKHPNVKPFINLYDTLSKTKPLVACLLAGLNPAWQSPSEASDPHDDPPARNRLEADIQAGTPERSCTEQKQSNLQMFWQSLPLKKYSRQEQHRRPPERENKSPIMVRLGHWTYGIIPLPVKTVL